jgi:hypothetical protein
MEAGSVGSAAIMTCGSDSKFRIMPGLMAVIMLSGYLNFGGIQLNCQDSNNYNNIYEGVGALTIAAPSINNLLLKTDGGYWESNVFISLWGFYKHIIICNRVHNIQSCCNTLIIIKCFRFYNVKYDYLLIILKYGWNKNNQA